MPKLRQQNLHPVLIRGEQFPVLRIATVSSQPSRHLREHGDHVRHRPATGEVRQYAKPVVEHIVMRSPVEVKSGVSSTGDVDRQTRNRIGHVPEVVRGRPVGVSRVYNQREDRRVPVLRSPYIRRQTVVDHAGVGRHACRHVAVHVGLDLDHHHHLAAVAETGHPKDIAQPPVPGAADELRRHQAQRAEVHLANPATGYVGAEQILDQPPVAEQALAHFVLGLRGIHTPDNRTWQVPETGDIALGCRGNSASRSVRERRHQLWV